MPNSATFMISQPWSFAFEYSSETRWRFINYSYDKIIIDFKICFFWDIYRIQYPSEKQKLLIVPSSSCRKSLNMGEYEGLQSEGQRTLSQEIRMCWGNPCLWSAKPLCLLLLLSTEASSFLLFARSLMSIFHW